MRPRWVTYLAFIGITALLVGPAVAQSTGSGSSAPASGAGTSGPTSPPPAPQPASPSVGTTPGTAMPPSAQPGTSQMGSKSQGSKTPMATNGQADAEQVKSLQKALQDKGMDPGPIDGVMGPKTQAAIRAYQKEQKLPETGRLDAQTREKLGVSR